MALNVAQPALSRQLRALEMDLGVVLFERGGRGLTLTPPGELFLARARSVLSDYAKARAEVLAAVEGRAGRLRVGFIPAAEHEVFLSHAIKCLRVDHPAIELHVHRMPSRDVCAGVQNGELDVGVFHHRPESDASLDFAVAHTDHYLLAVHRDHRLAGEPAVRLADLIGEPFVWHPQPPGFIYGRLIDACRAGGLSLKVIQEAESLEMILELVATGLGVTFIGSSVAASGHPPNIVLKEVTDLTVTFNLEVVWRRDTINPLVARFTGAVTRALLEQPTAARARGPCVLPEAGQMWDPTAS